MPFLSIIFNNGYFLHIVFKKIEYRRGVIKSKRRLSVAVGVVIKTKRRLSVAVGDGALDVPIFARMLAFLRRWRP